MNRPAMRYRLHTLLIVLALGLALILVVMAFANWNFVWYSMVMMPAGLVCTLGVAALIVLAISITMKVDDAQQMRRSNRPKD